MRTLTRFSSQHEDFIHDITYDYYGRRFATCSSDGKVKVWEQDGFGNWVIKAEWKAHQGSVSKLSWAHPEFGQVIASASFDRTVVVWEEAEGTVRISDGRGQAAWKPRATLADASGPVQDVQFSPRHLGLWLATGSLDGLVRVYDAPDVLNLSQFSLLVQFCATESEAGVVSLSWSQSPFHSAMLAIADGTSNARIWRSDQSSGGRAWVQACLLEGHEGPVQQIAWAPHLGRSFHCVATASLDGTARVWRLCHPSELSGGAVSGSGSGASGAGQAALVIRDCKVLRPTPPSEVWRVEWNVTGTVLASACEDGLVHLWRTNFQGEWKCLETACGDSAVAGIEHFDGDGMGADAYDGTTGGGASVREPISVYGGGLAASHAAYIVD